MSGPARETRKVLITVKTYPTPSMKYGETVCVAGVDVVTGEWLRLYPVPFRSLPDYNQFKKYHVVSVTVRKHCQDPRPESYDPDWDSLHVVDWIDTKDAWQTRWQILRPAISRSMCEIQRHQKEKQTSLGCFRPGTVENLLVRDDTGEWSGKQKQALMQLRLFQAAQKPLEKIPLKLTYVYKCSEPGCRGHRQRLLDWEAYQFYRARRAEGRTLAEVKQLLRQKFLGELCGQDKETHFFVGNHSSHFNSFMVLGVFWPPRRPPSLFG